MKQNIAQRRNAIIVAAALAGASALFLAKPASAQYRVGGNGHALDANNGIGSGGSNGSASNVGNGVNGNNILNRDVTGGRQFLGPINDADPRGFFGPTAYAPTDIFNRQANAPTNVPGAQSNNGVTQYYGDNRFAAPPAGSLPLGFNGGYINSNPNTPSSLSSGFDAQSDASSLQARTNPSNLVLDDALKSGNLSALMGNTLSQPGLANISPVYGQPIVNANGANNNTLELPEHASLDDIAQMRRDLLDSSTDLLNPSTSPNVKNPKAVQPNPEGTQPPPGLNDPLNKPLDSGFEAPLNGALSNALTSSQLQNNPLSNSGIVGRNPGQLPPMEQQSALLKTLQQKLEETGDVGKTLVDNVPSRTTASKKPAVPGETNPSGLPIAEVGTGARRVNNEPVPVSSLAYGISVKSLHDQLAGAEELVRQGKYDSAIQKYDDAARAATNNPLPILGRAQAELAGGYYAKAEEDLRSVFRSRASLMLMRFDLTTLFPKDRIAFVRKDLHDLAASDPAAVRPWYLLAYLDYNTGDSATAEQDLNEASQRAPGGDASIRSLQSYWALPSKMKANSTGGAQPAPTAVPAPEANK